MQKDKKTIWIDMDNSPHVPFFRPIIRELEARGYEIVLTARDCFQVCKLADLYKMDYRKVGVHYGKNKIMKGIGLLLRSAQLASYILKKSPDLALSHGSRSQMILSSVLHIPTVMMTDYEYAKSIPFFRPDWLIIPEMIPDSSVCDHPGKILRYSGLKEDVYVPGFRPEQGILDPLGLDPGKVIVIVRPPATEAHYFKEESLRLFEAAMSWLGAEEQVSVILLPRNNGQADFVRSRWPQLLQSGKVKIPDQVIPGLNLIWYSDLVISGGGTMNREAAALGVPVYSIFRGEIGSVDRHLSDTGRLTIIENADDLRMKVTLKKREHSQVYQPPSRPALKQIVDILHVILNQV
ncbi:DUF354 domain-containing protein [Geoanaerobacter pelophilus]|nr:DUF354 domain-containing protein [Geoanaerobacter pelophilus]